MGRHKSRYGRTTMADVKKNLVSDDSPAGLRAEFPEELVDLYVRLVNAEFADKEHKKYAVAAEKFLGDRFKDAVEQGKLVVRLAKATFDLVDKYNEKKKKTRKAKKEQGLARGQCPLPQVGADERKEQEEGKEQEGLAQGN